MDKAYFEKQLSGLSAMLPQPQPGRPNRCRPLRVYAEPLGKNFYVANPSGRPLSSDVVPALASVGIGRGWKAGAATHPREVAPWELLLMVKLHLFQTGRRH